MYEHVISGNCPNFFKAEVERAKSKTKESIETNSEDALVDDGPSGQPEKMDVVRTIIWMTIHVLIKTGNQPQ